MKPCSFEITFSWSDETGGGIQFRSCDKLDGHRGMHVATFPWFGREHYAIQRDSDEFATLYSRNDTDSSLVGRR